MSTYNNMTTASYEQTTADNVSSNVSTTHHNFDIEDFEFQDDVDQFHDRLSYYKYSLLLAVIFGTTVSLFPLTVLIRRRMWLRHEGYFFVTVYLLANLLTLTLLCLSKSLYFFNTRWHIADTSEASCKIWSILAQIIVSSDWLLVALLADVYLRRHLRSSPGKFGCRNFAGNYCTLFGARFVTGSAYVASFLVNWWRIVSAHLFSYDDLKICHLSLIWYEELWLWRFFALCVTQYVPVVMVTPLLCLMVVIANRGTTSSIQRNDDDVIDDDEGDARQLANLSLSVAGVTFLLKCPHFLLEMIIQTRRLWFTYEIAAAWYATELVVSVQLILVPVLCIAMLRETRAILWSLRLDRFGHRRF